MTSEDRSKIEALFPITVEITKEIIYRAKRYNTSECIGALAIMEILKANSIKELNVSWGDCSGFIYDDLSASTEIDIITSPAINMMEIAESTQVTFILNK